MNQWLSRLRAAGPRIRGPHVLTASTAAAYTNLLAPVADAVAGTADVVARSAHRWPLMGQFLSFHNTLRTDELDADGYEGDFAPPPPYSVRMYAGGSVEEMAGLAAGDVVEERVFVEDAVVKTGSAFDMVFVTLRHAYHLVDQGDILGRVERRRFMYRDKAAGFKAGGNGLGREPSDKAKGLVSQAMASCEVSFSSVDLFRYSALTYNAHRIHYDAAYCAEEGFPAPVVHGPLTASALVAMVEAKVPLETVQTFDFRLTGPLFVDEPITLLMARPEQSSEDGSTLYALHALDKNGAVAAAAIARTL